MSFETSKVVNASLMERHRNSQLFNVFPAADEVRDLSCEVIVTNPPENFRDIETQSLMFLENNHISRLRVTVHKSLNFQNKGMYYLMQT